MAREGRMPMNTDGWQADYPDAEDFMQLLYCRISVLWEMTRGSTLPEFDKLYEAAYKTSGFASSGPNSSTG
jgi:ABC-type oligopeptide transport system substrate-binding subunit